MRRFVGGMKFPGAEGVCLVVINPVTQEKGKGGSRDLRGAFLSYFLLKPGSRFDLTLIEKRNEVELHKAHRYQENSPDVHCLLPTGYIASSSRQGSPLFD